MLSHLPAQTNDAPSGVSTSVPMLAASRRGLTDLGLRIFGFRLGAQRVWGVGFGADFIVSGVRHRLLHGGVKSSPVGFRV